MSKVNVYWSAEPPTQKDEEIINEILGGYKYSDKQLFKDGGVEFFAHIAEHFIESPEARSHCSALVYSFAMHADELGYGVNYDSKALNYIAPKSDLLKFVEEVSESLDELDIKEFRKNFKTEDLLDGAIQRLAIAREENCNTGISL